MQPGPPSIGHLGTSLKPKAGPPDQIHKRDQNSFTDSQDSQGVSHAPSSSGFNNVCKCLNGLMCEIDGREILNLLLAKEKQVGRNYANGYNKPTFQDFGLNLVVPSFFFSVSNGLHDLDNP